MRIWVYASGEPLPAADRQVRLLRAGNLCRHLQAAGHEVVWWTSSFDHIRKRQLGEPELANAGLALRLVHAPGYRANFGFARLFDHAVLGWRFWRQAIKALDRPDVIWCCYPPMETAVAAVCIGKRFAVPVVLDVRDLWPDAFLDALPTAASGVARLMLLPYFKASAFALRNASALVGVTEPYLQWAVQRAGRATGQFDRCFPMGYPDFSVEAAAAAQAQAFWAQRGVSAGNFNLCFFGTLGLQFDIDSVLRAAALLEQRASPARFVMCGSGSALDAYRQQASGLGNVLFPGFVDVPEIKALMDLSAVGLAPYRDIENFQLNIPNKVFEYAAGSLPVLSGVDGEVGRLLRSQGIGHVYRAGDADALADLVERLASDRPSLQAQGARARALFSRDYDSSVVSAQIESYLQELVLSGNTQQRQ